MTLYDELVLSAEALLEGEPNRTARAANFSALLYERLPDLNWCGFYWLDRNLDDSGDELVVGPFQGRTACVRIPLGKGVCGTAAASRETQLVPNVHEFPGHIPCDCRSNSEIVLPVILPCGTLIGVLDIDSPTLDRFTEEDAAGLTRLVEVFVKSEG